MNKAKVLLLAASTIEASKLNQKDSLTKEPELVTAINDMIEVFDGADEVPAVITEIEAAIGDEGTL